VRTVDRREMPLRKVCPRATQTRGSWATAVRPPAAAIGLQSSQTCSSGVLVAPLFAPPPADSARVPNGIDYLNTWRGRRAIAPAVGGVWHMLKHHVTCARHACACSRISSVSHRGTAGHVRRLTARESDGRVARTFERLFSPEKIGRAQDAPQIYPLFGEARIVGGASHGATTGNSSSAKVFSMRF
jgi:hypothetical protein